MCISTHTLLLKQNLVDQDLLWSISCSKDSQFAGLLLLGPSGVDIPWVCLNPLTLCSLPWNCCSLVLGRQSELCLRERILKAMALVHSEPVRQESIFLHQPMGMDTLPDSVLAREGKVNSDIHSGEGQHLEESSRGLG